jgi:hypothetical protein
MEDPSLKNQQQISIQSNQLTISSDGLAIISISEDQIIFVGQKFNKIFNNKKKARNVITMLQSAVFSLSSKNAENPGWREHCSSSLRELLDEWSGDGGKICTAFNDVFKTDNASFPSTKTHQQEYKTLQEYYGYFSDICHYNATGVLQHLQFLLDETAKPGDDTPENFIKVVKNFIIFLFNFFSTHVKNNNGSNTITQ